MFPAANTLLFESASISDKKHKIRTTEQWDYNIWCVNNPLLFATVSRKSDQLQLINLTTTL